MSLRAEKFALTFRSPAQSGAAAPSVTPANLANLAHRDAPPLQAEGEPVPRTQVAKALELLALCDLAFLKSVWGEFEVSY